MNIGEKPRKMVASYARFNKPFQSRFFEHTIS